MTSRRDFLKTLPAVAVPLAGGVAGADVFLSGQPVWMAGRSREMNLFVTFRARPVISQPSGVALRLTASSAYRAFVNAKFAGYGPARGPHGWYRVDEWDIGPLLTPGSNEVVIEVAGYNVNSYYLLDQPAFLQAEVIARGKAIAATAAEGAGFEAYILGERRQRVQRYSFQRPFIEVYHFRPHESWPAAQGCERAPKVRLLGRGVPYPQFDILKPKASVSRGTVEIRALPAQPWRDRALTQIGPKLKGYSEGELELVVSNELQRVVASDHDDEHRFPGDRVKLGPRSFEVIDFGANVSGFIGCTVRAGRASRLYLTFDETLTDGDVDFKRLNCVNTVTLDMAAGEYRFESFEPYTLRYLKPVLVDGECTLEEIQIREYAHPQTPRAQFDCADPALNAIFGAARETFRQNAVDVFTDCPHRERAGWLCDSFFTARTAHALTGTTQMERNQFENYLLPARFEFLPEGMLPMCYPADHNDGVFIPNWALWFVLQLEEYGRRSGDRAMVRALEPRVMGVLDYFRPFRNEDGLLEKLQNWVFIEWSEANRFVQDVNYPSNMLYASALESAGRMYSRPEFAVEAGRMRETIRRQSFDGEFFVDNAVRENGRLKVTANRTEVCQYFAFYFGVATPETHGELWRRLRDDFGWSRGESGPYREIHKANAFVGNVLRHELLSRYGAAAKLTEELKAYYGYMAERTGTLWENVGAEASLNHGFASHVAVQLFRDVLGIRKVDGKEVTLRFLAGSPPRCSGRMPVGDGEISLAWQRAGRELRYSFATPPGFRVRIENPDGLTLERV